MFSKSFSKKILAGCFLVFGISFSGFTQEIRKVKITDVEMIIKESKQPLIVNVWATWCKPCIAELPYFIEEVKEHNKKGDSLQILLVSLDFKEAYPGTIKSFVAKRKWDVPVLWLDETNADYFCPRFDASWSGALPSTLLINNQTGYRSFTEGELKHDELKDEIKKLLNK